MDSPQLIRKLVESFNAVASELQTLTDRKTILEHKLRYAHEQYQALADKYAPCAPDIAETIAKLQVPPTPTSTSFVPLPSRLGSDSSQAQLAFFVREGKKVAQQLQAMADATKTSESFRDTSTKVTSEMSTVLEKDFTVQGKKGPLQCPFSAIKPDRAGSPGLTTVDAAPTPHPAGDPICAALIEENASGAATKSKCPIRYMDKHSPEEIARYVETHKHELPRSHEVCLRRNQKNEEQIRKLDAKYGNLVSMIEDLSYLHAPMLPEPGQEPEPEPAPEDEVGRTSDRRVSDWAQNVSATAMEGPTGDTAEAEVLVQEDDLDRTSHFDRPLKPVRVGESPSRPWGISVPIPPANVPMDRPTSPPAPVRIPSPAPAETPKASATRPSKCPFDHTKMRLNGPGLPEFPKMDEHHSPPRPPPPEQAARQPCPPSLKQPQPAPLNSPPPSHQPTFINTTGTATSKVAAHADVALPQMVFNGPVFIGYPMSDAIQFLQNFQGQQHQR